MEGDKTTLETGADITIIILRNRGFQVFLLSLPVSKCPGKHENSGGREYMPELQTKTKLAYLI